MITIEGYQNCVDNISVDQLFSEMYNMYFMPLLGRDDVVKSWQLLSSLLHNQQCRLKPILNVLTLNSHHFLSHSRLPSSPLRTKPLLNII